MKKITNKANRMQYPRAEITEEIQRICTEWDLPPIYFDINSRIKNSLGLFRFSRSGSIPCCRQGLPLPRIEIQKEMTVFSDRETVLSVVRHEMAHYIDYLMNGPERVSHGPNFQEINDLLGGSNNHKYCY